MFLSFLFSKSRKVGRRPHNKTHKKHKKHGGYSSRSNKKYIKTVKSHSKKHVA